MSKSFSLNYDISWPNHALLHGGNIEVNNTIIECVEELGLYSIDAHTDRGWLRLLAWEVDESQRGAIVHKLIELQQPWKTPRETALISWIELPSAQRSVSVFTLSPDVPAKSIEAQSNDWVFSTDEILIHLESENTSREDRITAVLFAETSSFSPSQVSRLLTALLDFCVKNRFSTDGEVATAVGAAVRKYAMNMSESDFESYSQLFLPTSTATLSCEIELELAKAASWRLAKLRNNRGGEFPNLEARLSELASDYLTARLVLQENYASIVMHAVLSVALLSGARQDEFIDRIGKLRIDWFAAQFARRLLDVAQKRRVAASEDGVRLERLYKRLMSADVGPK